jgi:hypothetical protein
MASPFPPPSGGCTFVCAGLEHDGDPEAPAAAPQPSLRRSIAHVKRNGATLNCLIREMRLLLPGTPETRYAPVDQRQGLQRLVRAIRSGGLLAVTVLSTGSTETAITDAGTKQLAIDGVPMIVRHPVR